MFHWRLSTLTFHLSNMRWRSEEIIGLKWVSLNSTHRLFFNKSNEIDINCIHTMISIYALIHNCVLIDVYSKDFRKDSRGGVPNYSEYLRDFRWAFIFTSLKLSVRVFFSIKFEMYGDISSAVRARYRLPITITSRNNSERFWFAAENTFIYNRVSNYYNIWVELNWLGFFVWNEFAFWIDMLAQLIQSICK